ncbi:MAG: PD40 domain-containing protein [Candidatus Latescibacterota bacterium]|nr:MAG: PD40 domain-containing protein [Candidatus Latescibacterota bacterium]
MKIKADLYTFLAVILLGVCVGCSGTEDAGTTHDDSGAKLSGEYVGQTPPGNTPELFAPGVISTGLYERDVAMTPDGSELYFGLMSGGYSTIVVTRRQNGVWTKPEIAPFCDNPDVFDLEPHITPDGKRFMFLSTRPQEGQEPKSGWVYQDIWVMDRTADGWSEPYNLGPPVNSDAPEYFPSVTKDGTVYFSREVTENGQRKSLIFRSRLVDGEYTEAEALPKAVNPGGMQFNAFIDPEERYLIVGIADHEDNIGRYDYYVSFRGEDDSWTGPINMGELVNTPGNTVVSPYVSPDGKYFFFSSNRKGERDAGTKRSYESIKRMTTEPQNGAADIYWVNASFIEALRP